MAIKKTSTGWQVDIQPSRQAPRIRKTFKTKAEAVRHETLLKQRHNDGQELKPKKDTRRLTDLIDLYDNHHVQYLKCKKRLGVLRLIAKLSGNPYANELTPEWYFKVKAQRAGMVKPNTLNHDRAFLHNLFEELRKARLWHGQNPIADTKKVKHDPAPVTFLSQEQIKLLLKHLKQSGSRHVYLVALICLSTGARWSEAETLTVQQIGKDIISLWKTKSGKERHIPISQQLARLIQHHERHSLNRLFGSCYNAFTLALEKSGIRLPERQRTHVLRHTFASHFVQNGGSLLELQKILGHSTIHMTMRYAHLAPGHLHNAKKLNPLAALTLG